MKRYRGNQSVGPGVYFNLRQLSFAPLMDEGRLPGSTRDVYRRVPAVVLVFFGPVIGGLYVVFLPVIGFVMLAWVASEKLARLAAAAAAAAARVVKPTWEPARAFFSRVRPSRRTARRRDRWVERVSRQLEDKKDESA